MTDSSVILRQLWAAANGAIPLVRRDSGLYLFIAIYTLAGLVFLHTIGAADRSAYSIYFGRWILLNGVMLPVFAILVDVSLLHGARCGLPAVRERRRDGDCRERSEGKGRDERYRGGAKPVHR